ncbi:YheC/YheD family protein [Halobacillus kuroshimensis]|uniref:YheC/YheD family protein n=1 Tax=Halobacillus kuroshimensis TaxID=302481 RepID=A0ABS3DWI5_9BACI|nr:YheC/YheD family protein [Halobacillus kuroshimensis]MBN8235683.1 YheC/YheD family protein [Halobacillus kuroshimensis]
MYQVNKGEGTGTAITLHPSSALKEGMENGRVYTWEFGLQSCQGVLRTSDQVDEDQMVMSGEVLGILMLPMEPHYEVKCERDTVHIGPIIGIVASSRLEGLQDMLHKLRRYVKNYESFGGAVIAFSNEAVDVDKRLVAGYLFDPVKREWTAGIYPFPQVIIKRVPLKKKWQKQFHQLIGDRIFHSGTFTKWEMYTWFQSSSFLKPYLPETKIFQGSADFLEMLETHHCVYVKPVKGMQGKRVAKVLRTEKGMRVIYIHSEDKKEFLFPRSEDGLTFLKEVFAGSEVIVQQGLDLQYEGRVNDFRAVMVKNGEGSWESFALMGRTSQEGQIVSNRHQGGKIEPAVVMLERMFKEKEKVSSLIGEIEELALRASEVIENCGFHYCKLGIDIGVDRHGRVWLIEINHRNPNDFVASFTGDKELANRIRTANMLYAKRVAGFK